VCGDPQLVIKALARLVHRHRGNVEEAIPSSGELPTLKHAELVTLCK
jgi:hypothetical protein